MPTTSFIVGPGLVTSPHVRVHQVDATQHAVETVPPAPPREPATFTSAELFPHVIARMPLAESAIDRIDRIDPFSPATTEKKKKEDPQRLIGEFPLISDGQCRPMKEPPCHLQLNEGVNPVATRGPQIVSVPLMPRPKEELDTLLKQSITRRVIDATSTFIINVGMPVNFLDNGPHFASTECFPQDWGIIAGTSFPHYAQSNRTIEATITSAKKIITGSSKSGSFDKDQFDKALLLIRNASWNGAASPAQPVFQRPVRDSPPAVMKKAEESYIRRAHPLPALTVGTHVPIQHLETKRWATAGFIVENVGRDLPVKTAAGKVFRRNRRFLHCVPVVPHYHPPAAAIPPEPPPATSAPIPGSAQPVQLDAPLRRSARPKAPSTRSPAHTWTNYAFYFVIQSVAL